MPQENEAVARAEFVIDHTPPKIQFYQVEEGAQYEGILNFQVDSRKKEDWIEEVLINGKRQTLKKEDGKYTFQITNPGEYEVSVTAADLAGNEAEENISFEIVPEKTILGKRRQRQFNKYYLERQKRSRKIGKEKKKTVILPC